MVLKLRLGVITMGKFKQFCENNGNILVGAVLGCVGGLSLYFISGTEKKTPPTTFEARDVTGDGIEDIVLEDGTNRVLVANKNGLYEMTTIKPQGGHGFLVDQQGGFYDLKGNYFPPCVNRGGECPPPIKK